MTNAWSRGFDDGVEGLDCNPQDYNEAEYLEGYSTGEMERRVLDRDHSSNS